MDEKNRWLLLVGAGMLIALLAGAAGVCVPVAVLGLRSNRRPPSSAATPAASTAAVMVGPTLIAVPTLAIPPPNIAPQTSLNRKAGIPEDIPIPINVETGAFVGRDGNFSFLTDLSYPQMLAFYQQQLPKAGWSDVQFGSKIGRASAELNYTKGSRQLSVRITGVPNVGTVVEVVESN